MPHGLVLALYWPCIGLVLARGAMGRDKVPKAPKGKVSKGGKVIPFPFLPILELNGCRSQCAVRCLPLPAAF